MGRMKPLIGITTHLSNNEYGQARIVLQQAYADAIHQAGGVPVLIPSLIADDGWDALYAKLDGILLSGGGDVALGHFAGEDHPRISDVEPARDAIELTLARAAVNDNKPFVALGGTLYTHLPDQFPNALDHSYPGNMRHALVHQVKIEEGTRFADVLGEPIVRVNSHHHQGLKDIAPALRVAGHAPDGLVEAVELPDHPFGLAVQWHPEWLTDQTVTRNLFKKFVEAAG